MRTIILGIVLLFLLSACTAPAAPTTQPAAENPPSQEIPKNDDTPVVPVARADPAILKLFERSDSVKSYKFDLYDIVQKKSKWTFYVKGDRAMLDLILSQNLEPNEPDYVYLDLAAKTAREYCMDTTRCETPGSSWSADYGTYGITMPKDWIESFKYGKKTGSLTFDSRQVNILKYQADGKWYEGYIDPYYGYVVRVAIANDEEMTDIVGGYEFRSMAFNTVKDSEVTPP